jgi:hypothetical protein
MPKYAIAITEETLDLIEFLNDGVRPKIEDRPTAFIFEINPPTEISSQLEHTFMLFGNEPPKKLQIFKL